MGWFATNDGSSEYFIIEPHTRYAVANDDAANDNGCCDYLITPEVDLTGRTIIIFCNIQVFTLAYMAIWHL
ncbi:MAG: hypothetical protein AB2L17_19595 [Lentimicrobium sp.]